ncbi:carboxypeptidase regulatory-like domain-containing protein [Patescibacteria group bacterium]|nr:carboxypeptidase regulatory-like domain-containing protein [Patescibacteria group bacterium]
MRNLSTITTYLALIVVLLPWAVSASATDGTIDDTNRYAWSENLGWVDFGSDEGDVHVTDDDLRGHAYGETIGWITLNCESTSSCDDVDYGVDNNGEGTLSGYGWGENVGWVRFDPPNGGVTIDDNGIFSGHAWNESSGWIVFNCATTDSCDDTSYYVETDWRPQSVRPACNNGIDDDGDGDIDFPDDADCASLDGTSESSTPTETNSEGGGGSGTRSVTAPRSSFDNSYIIVNDDDLTTLSRDVTLAISGNPDGIAMRIANSPLSFDETFIPIQDEVGWDLCDGFVVCLSGGYTVYIQFQDVLGNVSSIISDRITLVEPSLRTTPALQTSEAQTSNGFFRIRSVPSLLDHEGGIPSETKELSIRDFASFPDTKVEIAVAMPNNQRASSMTGLLIARNLHREVPRSPLAWLFNQAYAQESDDAILVESFPFSSSDDENSLFEGEFQTPDEPSVYEVLTYIKLEGDSDEPTILRMVGTVAPTGYVYQTTPRGESRIKDALVTLHWINPDTHAFEVWPALDFDQINSQVTDATGRYSFFVPEGSYYLEVSAPGYRTVKTPMFYSRGDGRVINIPIELEYVLWWAKLARSYETIVWVILATFLLAIGWKAIRIKNKKLRRDS